MAVLKLVLLGSAATVSVALAALFAVGVGLGIADAVKRHKSTR